MDPLKTTAAVLYELAAARGLAIAASSPLSAADRRGQGPGAPASVPDEIEEALYIAAEPEALVRVRVLVPGATEPATIGAVVRDGRCARFTIDGAAVELSPAIDLEELAASLAADAAYAGPLAGQEAYFWPSALKMLSLLWQESQDPTQPISRAATVKRLSSAGPAAEAEKAIDEMVRVGLVRAEGDILRLDPTVQPWLALVWSGHVLQIEHLPLAGRSFAEAVDGTGELLLFLGPPGQRIVSLRLTGEAMRKHVQGGAPPNEDALVRLFAPPPDRLRTVLAVVLKLQAAPVA
jgi:hypothetical protein